MSTFNTNMDKKIKETLGTTNDLYSFNLFLFLSTISSLHVENSMLKAKQTDIQSEQDYGRDIKL